MKKKLNAIIAVLLSVACLPVAPLGANAMVQSSDGYDISSEGIVYSLGMDIAEEDMLPPLGETMIESYFLQSAMNENPSAKFAVEIHAYVMKDYKEEEKQFQSEHYMDGKSYAEILNTLYEKNESQFTKEENALAFQIWSETHDYTHKLYEKQQSYEPEWLKNHGIDIVKSVNGMVNYAIVTREQLEKFPVSETSGYKIFLAPLSAVNKTSSSSTVSEKVLAEIESGKQSIEVVVFFKSISYSEIIQEVNQKSEEYRQSLSPEIYTPDEINEMTGYFKMQLNDELVKSAWDAYHKEICESLGIAMEDVDFSGGGNSMVCTLTPEQIMTATESDWFSRQIILESEIVTEEELGYEAVLADDSEEAEETLIPYVYNETDEFADDRVIVVLKKDFSELNHEWNPSDFNFENISEIKDLTHMEMSPEQQETYLQQVNFHQILCVYLKEKGTEQVLNAVKALEQNEMVLNVSPDTVTYAMAEDDISAESAKDWNYYASLDDYSVYCEYCKAHGYEIQEELPSREELPNYNALHYWKSGSTLINAGFEFILANDVSFPNEKYNEVRYNMDYFGFPQEWFPNVEDASIYITNYGGNIYIQFLRNGNTQKNLTDDVINAYRVVLNR